MSDRFFGCHVSSAGGLHNALQAGRDLGVNTIQIHPSPPQRWLYQGFKPSIEDQFNEMRGASGVQKVFFHGVYLINLASPDAGLVERSIQSLQFYLDLQNRIGGDGVIFHVGSNKDQPSEEAGFLQAAQAIDTIMGRTQGPTRLLLEVAAGSGRIVGDKLEELRFIYDNVQNKERVGFALDTQHLWASGYDLANSLDDFVGSVSDHFGIDKVWAIHLNDSKTELGSRKDRHENVGKGLIGEQALTAFLHHPILKPIPVILETPALKDMESAKVEVNELRRLLKE